MRTFTRRPTDNLQAYDYYLRAKRALHGYGEGLHRATMSLCQETVELDPQLVDAYAGDARAGSRVAIANRS